MPNHLSFIHSERMICLGPRLLIYPFIIIEWLQLLEKNPGKRLGVAECVHGEVSSQPFFRPLDFALLERRQILPPFKPKLVTSFGKKSQ